MIFLDVGGPGEDMTSLYADGQGRGNHVTALHATDGISAQCTPSGARYGI